MPEEESVRGLGPISDETYQDEWPNRLSPEQAKKIGGSVIVYLMDRLGEFNAYEGRFTRVRDDEVSFIINIAPGVVEGRRFAWRKGHSLTRPSTGTTEAQRQRAEIGREEVDGYFQKAAPTQPEIPGQERYLSTA